MSVQKSLDMLFSPFVLPICPSRNHGNNSFAGRLRSIWRRISLMDSFVQKVASMFLGFFHRSSSNSAAAPQITVGLFNSCCCFHTNK